MEIMFYILIFRFIRTATNFYVTTTCLALHLPTSSGTVVVTVVVVPVVSVGGA